MAKIAKSHISPYFKKQFNKLPNNFQKIAAKKLLLFENNSFHPSLNTHKLKGHLSSYWSFYVNDNYRIMFRFLKNNEMIYYDIDTHNIYQ